MSDITVTPETRAAVEEAFAGFIGNAEPVHAIKRSLLVALSRKPPALDRTFLLMGPPSTGKSELARRVTKCLGLPFVQLDGRAVKSREHLFVLLDEALAERELSPTHAGTRGGVPVVKYPPFAVYIDEVHLVSERTQQTFLTLLERDDRSVLLDSSTRRVAIVHGSAFILATTKPAELDRALRSRCTEIELARYTVAEVAQMVARRHGQLPSELVTRIAIASRLTPRVAFDIARDVLDELWTSDDPSASHALERVLQGRGVVIAEYPTSRGTLAEIGLSANDIRYLRIVARERRPMGEAVIAASMGDVDAGIVRDDVEPWLLRNELVRVAEKGREITERGRSILMRVANQ